MAELAVALADGDRLSRGRRYQRKGQVFGVHVESGLVTASVNGSRADPYEVSIAVREASENTVTAAATNPAEAAPRAVEVAFSCVCPDWGDPCKHGVAALLELAREIDDDPSLLLRWRGIDDVVPPPPPGTESLRPVADTPVRRPTGSVPVPPARRSSWGDPAEAPDGGLDPEVLAELTAAAAPLVPPKPAGPYPDGLVEFFTGEMPVDGDLPIGPLDEAPLDAYHRVRIMLETHDAAPPLADAVDTIAEHWQTR